MAPKPPALLPILLGAALALGLAAPLPAQVHYQGRSPWNRLADSGPDAEVDGWYYNLGITGLRAELMPDAPKQLLVRPVFAGTPAAGRVAVGAVLTGAGVGKRGDEIPIRGGSSDETLIRVGGVPMKDARAGTSSAKGIDSKSVSAMDLITGGWRAEYGDAMAGVINVTLKEGGETFNGFAEYGMDHLPGVVSDWEHYYTDTYKFQLSGPSPAAAAGSRASA